MGNEEGWYMPQTFSSVIEEHLAARASCGIFDISHLGKFSIRGNGALAWLEGILSNSISSCKDGHTQKTLMLKEEGTIIDKMTLCRESAGKFFLLGTPSMAETDADWLRSHLPLAPLELFDETEQWSAMAVYGPDSEKVFSRVLRGLDMPLPTDFQRVVYQNDELLLTRTGMQGEEGFELFCPANSGISWYESFIAAGAIPCGMSTRECMRLERGYAALRKGTPSLTPAEASLERFCSREKEYLGSDILRKQSQADLKLAPLRCTEESDTPTPGCDVQGMDGESVGKVTSGCISPVHGCGLALAQIAAGYARPGTRLRVIIHGRSVPAIVADTPLS